MTSKPLDEKEIFKAAYNIASDEARMEFLQVVCHDDPELFNRVRNLLEQSNDDSNFLESPPIPVATGHAKSETDSFAPTRIGLFTIREQIGEGGMGVVYVAEQTEPVQRKVAIKIIKPGMDTKEVIARFEAERQALAFMEHPNIAKVLDAGATENGRSYFVMELVRGIPITEYCDQVKASPQERLSLFMTVCDAVQHAHQKGIIHRDIKPSNVLVTQVNSKPVPKVIDFGLAKATSGQRLTEKTLYTGFMRLMGTPAYMSPEQAELSGVDVDTRSDIYSLGILLYELLTGTTPLDKTEIKQHAYDELCRQIREAEAPKPSARLSTLTSEERTAVAQLRKIDQHNLQQVLQGDLDQVVLKAIEKDRDRRYGSPRELVEDIERFLDDKPVAAVAPSVWYLARKYLRRHKVAFFTAATIGAVLILATALSTIQAVRLSHANRVAAENTESAIRSKEEANVARNTAELERGRADAARQDATVSRDKAHRMAEERRHLLYAANMQLANQLWNSGNGTPKQVNELLNAWIPTSGERDFRDCAWRFQWNRLHLSAEQTAYNVHTATVSRRGNLLVADQTGIREWDDATKSFVPRWEGGVQQGGQIELSPCGRWAAVPDDEHLSLIDVETGNKLHVFPGNLRARFATGGDHLLVWQFGRDRWKAFEYSIIDVSTGTQRKLTDSRKFFTSGSSVSPDGASYVLAIDAHWMEAHLDGNGAATWRFDMANNCSAWSPNGKLFASGLFTGAVRLRFLDDPDHVMFFNTGQETIYSLAFSNDSTKLAAGGVNGKVNVYDVSHFFETEHTQTDESQPKTKERPSSTTNRIASIDPPRSLFSLNVHLGLVNRIVFASDNSSIATCDSFGTAKLTRLGADPALLPTPSCDEWSRGGYAPLKVIDTVDGVRVADGNRQSTYFGKLEIVRGSVNEGDRIVALSDSDGHLEIDSAKDANNVKHRLFGSPGSIVTVHIADDETKSVQTADLYRNSSTIPLPINDLVFTKDSKSIVVTSDIGAFRASLTGEIQRHYPSRSNSAAVSPDGRILALDDCKELFLWDLENHSLLDRLPASVSEFPTPFDSGKGGVARFSPDGRFIVMGTGHPLGTTRKRSDLKIWDLATRKEIGSPFYKSNIGISGIAFTPDSEYLVVTFRNDGAIRVWNTSTWNLEWTLSGIGNALTLDFSPDGKTMVQAGLNGFVIWDFKHRRKRYVIRAQSIVSAQFTDDGDTLMTTSMDSKLAFWNVAAGVEITSIDLGTDVLMGGRFNSEHSNLAVYGQQGRILVWDIPDIEQIDQHAAMIESLYQRALVQNQDGLFSSAEQTMLRALRASLKTPSSIAEERRKAISSELLKALKGQGKLVVTKQPRSQMVKWGTPVEMHVEATPADGLGRLEYRWFFNGAPIENATTSRLTLQKVTESDVGRYHAEIGYPGFDSIKVQSEGAFLVSPDGTARGGLKKDVFLNIPDRQSLSVTALTGLARFPDEPDFSGAIGSFELPDNFADDYGVKISGMLIPPKTGDYVFFVASDDGSQLFLSTDESPANKKLIASESKWHPLKRGWQSLGPDSISPPQTLQAGKRYWIEALFREAGVDDHFAVAWQMPGEPPPKNGDPPIPGEFLEFHLE